MKFILPTMLDEWHKSRNPAQFAKTFNRKTNLDSPNPMVECHCGIRVPMDMMVDVRNIPNHLKDRRAGDFVCDGCKEKLHLEGILTYTEFAQHYTNNPQALERFQKLDTVFPRPIKAQLKIRLGHNLGVNDPSIQRRQGLGLL